MVEVEVAVVTETSVLSEAVNVYEPAVLVVSVEKVAIPFTAFAVVPVKVAEGFDAREIASLEPEPEVMVLP